MVSNADFRAFLEGGVMISQIISVDDQGNAHSISEAQYKQNLINERRDDFQWCRSVWGGKSHMMIPHEDFSVTLCKKMVDGRDSYPEQGDDSKHRCKSCLKALTKESKV